MKEVKKYTAGKLDMCLRLIEHGVRNEDIAQALGINLESVRVYKSRLNNVKNGHFPDNKTDFYKQSYGRIFDYLGLDRPEFKEPEEQPTETHMQLSLPVSDEAHPDKAADTNDMETLISINRDILTELTQIRLLLQSMELAK